MKYALSMSVAAAAFVAVVGISALSPQKYLYELAINRVLDDPSYTIAWEGGTANLQNLVFKWPQRNLSDSWVDAAALSFLEHGSVLIRDAQVELDGKFLQLNGFYEPSKIHLTLQEDEKNRVTVQKTEGAAIWTFRDAPLSLLQSFTDFKDIKGTITAGFIDENKRGNLEISDFSYEQNQFHLNIARGYVELKGTEANIIGVDLALAYEDKPLWYLNPLSITFRLEKGLPFTVSNHTTVQFTDERLDVSSYIKNLKAEGTLNPARLDLLAFDRSSLIPLSDEALIQLTHMASCDYQAGKMSSFALLGEEICCEVSLNANKQFSLEFSEYLLGKLGLTEIPLNQMYGTIEKESGLWKISAQLKNGKVDAYLTSLLFPEFHLKEATLALDEWKLQQGSLLKDVFVHYSPEKSVWRANYEGIPFQGSGRFINGMDIQFQGGGTWDQWKSILTQLNVQTPLLSCPMDGLCTVTQGSIIGTDVKLVGEIANIQLGTLRNIQSKFEYDNGIITASNVTGKVDYKGKEFSFLAPKITYGKGLEFDGWIADQSQEYVRLAGMGSFYGDLLHLEFDRSKTHFLNIIPDFFAADLKNWTTVHLLEFVGKGPFRTPFFEDLNRFTHHADWNIALFYEPNGLENEFQILKGPLTIEGTMQDLSSLQISELSLDSPFLALHGSGRIDLDKMVVQLNPVEFDINFEHATLFPSLPLTGGFSAVGNLVAGLDHTESRLEISPDQLMFANLKIPNTPFHLHQKGENLSFKCNFVMNEKLFTGFDCLMNKQGLKAKNQNTSFYVGNTHFGIDRAGLIVRGRHSPDFALLDPVTTNVEIAKAFLPFDLTQIEGGTIYLDNTHCCIKDTHVLGKEIDQIDFDFETASSSDLLLKNLTFKNDGESIAMQMATLSFDKGHLKKVATPSLIAQNISFSPLMITKCNVNNFVSEWPFNSFTGDGRVAFSNLLALLADSIRPEEVSELSYIDTKWFLPNQGEIAFEAKKEHLVINDLKDCFSRGKMIRFELNPEMRKAASLMWDGSLHLPLKLKPQHLSFKWSELFCLNLHGTMRDPHLELRKK